MMGGGAARGWKEEEGDGGRTGGSAKSEERRVGAFGVYIYQKHYISHITYKYNIIYIISGAGKWAARLLHALGRKAGVLVPDPARPGPARPAGVVLYRRSGRAR